MRLRLASAGALGFVLAGASVGCGLPADDLARWWKAPAVSDHPRVDAAAPLPPVVDAAIPPPDVGAASGAQGGASADGSDANYERMCAQYCQSLVDTGFYSCLGSTGGSDVSGCHDRAGTPDLCVRDRCVPHRVTLSTCFAQCDSLARFYGAVCATDATPERTQCPLPPAEHDGECRARCVF